MSEATTPMLGILCVLESLVDGNERYIVGNEGFFTAHLRYELIKSSDVVKSYISRIEAVQPLINAYVDERFHEPSRKPKSGQPHQLGDQDRGRVGERDPFLGVPFSAKEAVSVKESSDEFLRGGRVDHKDCELHSSHDQKRYHTHTARKITKTLEMKVRISSFVLLRVSRFSIQSALNAEYLHVFHILKVQLLLLHDHHARVFHTMVSVTRCSRSGFPILSVAP
ncbi:hypothetical protein CEXT_533491 [Caerostris extrusa]|uniref:Uncharacterized protein n=1 Tax=Caerostris extrusa TaxID=172846 RepID=A0AAV4XRV7_CAEEX|nr:hypothetical protein CEXT_533491 [Caerostris extrusa]